jgi:hypothetical protein
VPQAVQHLPGKHQALSSNSTTTQKKNLVVAPRDITHFYKSRLCDLPVWELFSLRPNTGEQVIKEGDKSSCYHEKGKPQQAEWSGCNWNLNLRRLDFKVGFLSHFLFLVPDDRND